MSFEKTKFGYAGGATTADSYGVSNHYGPRDVGKGQGTTSTEGFMNELTLDVDGEMLANDAFPLLAPQLPAGALIKDVVIEVSEVFDVTGGAMSIGTEGSEVANGLEVTAAQLGALGVTDLTATLTGTWLTGLAAVTDLGLTFTAGAEPVGKARVVIRYMKA